MCTRIENKQRPPTSGIVKAGTKEKGEQNGAKSGVYKASEQIWATVEKDRDESTQDCSSLEMVLGGPCRDTQVSRLTTTARATTTPNPPLAVPKQR